MTEDGTNETKELDEALARLADKRGLMEKAAVVTYTANSLEDLKRDLDVVLKAHGWEPSE